MDARRLVFDVGDRVTGQGRMVADADGVWLDMARFEPLVLPGTSRARSKFSVRLNGVDADAVPAMVAPDSHPGWLVTVSGVWLGEAIEVQAPPRPGPPPARADPGWTTPPCPPPAGCWPRGELDFDRAALQNSAGVVSFVTFRPSPNQAVLVVAADDIDAIEQMLRPQLTDRLCAVASRWTREQLDNVRAHLERHGQDWTVETFGDDIDDHAQARIEVELVRVTSDLAQWAAALPDGLMRLVPALIPLVLN